ncbi:ATP-binding cassette domain-containing protein [Brevibacillus nitrificans]|uniref:ATP-binding cassette domain-containing protein n=1 Tax=Brevibacillus nitrificans TaxID=651560 RepID=A0A3M8DKR5_9BACL|nr:ATP-binding cassette domain-containing protein [Brevibacillus nitrificans]RNB88638.1 ATP-binding cassette domain-containing protein [Brevibacillus nitrificans]
MSSVVRLEEIFFQRQEREVITDVHLQIDQGERWVFLGRNGSGKTTILELITGYLFPSKGSVQVLGHTYGECDVREIRKRIGYVSQSLFERLTSHDPVWEVVATGEYSYLRMYEEMPPKLKEKAYEKLEQFGLTHLHDQLIGSLSQGERKKVMLARALMKSPDLLVLDEVCSGLDLYEREQVLMTLEKTVAESTLIYVTHHLDEIVPLFTHCALFERGKIIAAGAKHEVLTTENLSRAYHVPLELDWHNDRPILKLLGSPLSNP